MSKFLLFSDIHVHPHKRSQNRLFDCLKALDWCLEKAVENSVDAVMFGGDLLHDRQKIDSQTYVEVFKVLEKYQKEKFKVYLLVGNHDMWFASAWSVASVYPFKSLSNFEVIDKTTSFDVCGVEWHFMPYTHHPIEELEKLPQSNIKNSYLLGHLSIDGAKLNSAGSIADVVIEHDGEMVKVNRNLFTKYKHVFLGHYHSSQKLTPTIEYIGSPLQLSYGEAGEKKHIIILDSDTNERTYIENDFSPRHYYIEQSRVDDINEIVGEKHLKDAFITVLADDLTDKNIKKEIETLVESHGLQGVQIKQKKSKDDEHVILDAKEILIDEDKMLEKYVDQVNMDKLEKKLLLDIGHQIINFSKSEE